ncbi:MAG: hypothetical protein V4714_15345 [Bacteroidota bacterium]
MNSEDVSNNIFSRKESLHRNTEKYKQAIEEQVTILKENAGQISKVALVVGGTLAVSYLLVRLFTRSRKKEKVLYASGPGTVPVQPHYKEESVIVRTIKGYIATFLISLAQQKLQEIIAHYKENDTEGDSKKDSRK